MKEFIILFLVFDYIHPYGLCILSGILLVTLIYLLFFQKKDNQIEIESLIFFTYLGAFIGGKLLYLFEINFYNISFLILSGGFSLLGASLGGILGFFYYKKKNKISSLAISIIPILTLLVHAGGRIGCYFSNCCDGNFFGFSLYPIVILFYFISSIIGMLLYKKKILRTLKKTFLYYVFIIFLERFVFDIFRNDTILTSYILTKYQFIAIIYLLLSIILIFIITKKKS